jgi:hypothetical protein
MFKTPTLAVMLGLIAAGAVVHGAVTQRWQTFTPDPTVTNRLHALEVRFGDWQPSKPLETDLPLNERSVGTAREYRSDTARKSAVVTIISGIPGSVSTHTPDVCYPGSGYKTLRGPKKETADLPGGQTATVYVADFEKKSATKQDRVRVRWAWSTDGTWIAPDNPRWQFARQLTAVPVLYKVYVATPLPDDDAQTDDDPATRAFVAQVWAQYSAGFGK